MLDYLSKPHGRRDAHRIWHRYGGARDTDCHGRHYCGCRCGSNPHEPACAYFAQPDALPKVPTMAPASDQRRIITTPIAVTTLASESDSVEVSVFYV